MRASLLVIVAGLVTFACREDPARSVKITSRPSRPASVLATSSRSPDPNWHLGFCPPPEEDSRGPGSFVAGGPCGFKHQGPVSCEAAQDDFYVALTRKAKGGATLVIYLNVERYHGPGSYDGAEMFVAAQDATTIYRWSSDSVRVTVSPGEAFVTLPVTRLAGEPMLVDCTRLIGPATNYQYQCGGLGDGAIAIDRTAEVVSGRLQCGKRQKEQ